MQILITYVAWVLLVKKLYEYFISYKDDDNKIKLLHIMLPKASAYVKNYDGIKKELDWNPFTVTHFSKPK